MRKSQKKLLINNALMFTLAIAGLLLLAFGYGVVDKIIAIIVIAIALGLIK